MTRFSVRILAALAAAGAVAWATSLYPKRIPQEAVVVVQPLPVSITGDNSLIRQAYAKDALEQHMEQWKSGILDEIEAGTRCWCCKGPHFWEWCAMNPKTWGWEFPEVAP